MIISREERKFYFKSFLKSILMIALMSFDFFLNLKKIDYQKIFSIAKKSF